jgi:hypothetical protein
MHIAMDAPMLFPNNDTRFTVMPMPALTLVNANRGRLFVNVSSSLFSADVTLSPPPTRRLWMVVRVV